jgi:hypothetical protein
MLSADPFQATPMIGTVATDAVLTSSTEGASELQVLQPGAQNQNATGAPAY